MKPASAEPVPTPSPPPRGRASGRGSPRPHFAIVGCIGEHNAGDEALFLSTLQQLRTRWPEARFTAFTNDEAHTRATYSVEAVSALGILAPATAIAAARQGTTWKTLRTLARCDCLVVCGGELIRTDFGLKATLSIFDRVLLARLFGKKRLFLGVGAGALDDPLQMSLIRFASRSAPVLAREAESFQRLQAARVGVPVEASDMALLLQPAAPRLALPEGPWCAISLRDPATTRSCRGMAITREEVVRRLAAAADHVVEALGMAPVFVPFGLEPDDDRRFHRDVHGAMRHGAAARLLEDELPVDQLLGLMGRASLVLGMRLHACVFAINQNVPVVGVAYDAKVRKQFEYFGLERCCTPIDGPDELPRLLDEAHAGAAAISTQMSTRLQVLRSRVSRSIDAVLQDFQPAGLAALPGNDETR